MIRSRFKCLLFVLRVCHKLGHKFTTWLVTRCHVWYSGGFAGSRKSSAQPSCTWDHTPLAGSLKLRGSAAAASSIPASSSQLLQVSMSRASNSTSVADVRPFTPSLATKSRQSHYTPESTSQNSGTMTPERTGDFQIDMIPLIHGESDRENSRSEIPIISLLGVGSPQEGVSQPTHVAPSQTDSNPPHIQIAFPMNPESVSRYARHSPM